MFKYTVIKNIPLPIIKDTFWTIDTPISTEIKLLLPRDIDLQDKNLVNANLISASNVSISSGLTTSTILAPSSEPLKMYVYNNDLEIVATRNNVQNSINVYDSITNLTSEKYWEVNSDGDIQLVTPNELNLQGDQITNIGSLTYNKNWGITGLFVGDEPSLIYKIVDLTTPADSFSMDFILVLKNYKGDLSTSTGTTIPLITEEQVSQIGTNTTAIETKQPLLTAGDNITISPTNEISATYNNYWEVDGITFQNLDSIYTGASPVSINREFVGASGKIFNTKKFQNLNNEQNAPFFSFNTFKSTLTTTPYYVTNIKSVNYNLIQDDNTTLLAKPILQLQGYDIDENTRILYITETLRNYNVTAGEIPVLPLITEAQVTQIETNKTAIATKQNTLTAGANITISPTNEISATGGDTLWEFVGNKVQLVTPKSLVMQTQHIEDVSSINFVGGAAIGYNPGTGLSEGTEPGIIIFDVAHSKIINLGSALKNFVGSSYDTPIIPAITEQDIANIQTNYNLVKDINKGILFTKLSLPNADTPVQLLTEDRLFVPTTTFTGYTFNAATSSITLPVGYRYRFELFDTGTTGGNRAAEWTITVTQNGVTETFTTDGSSTKTIIITDPNNIVTATYGTNLVAYGGHDINYNIIVLGLIDTTQKIISLTNS